MDEYDHAPDLPGALTADLAQFFNVNLDHVWTGEVSPRFVLKLVGHLSFIPESRTRALRLGGDLRFIGWDKRAEIAADTFDLIQATIAGFGGQPLTQESYYPRPGGVQPQDATPAEEKEASVPSIAEFSVGAFMREINS